MGCAFSKRQGETNDEPFRPDPAAIETNNREDTSTQRGPSENANKASSRKASTAVNLFGSQLAWPGRSDVDPQAPFIIEGGLTGKTFPEQGKFGNWDVELAYYELRGGQTKIPLFLKQEFTRQTWLVGIAVNPWRIVERTPRQVKHLLAHQGLYIRLQSSDDEVS